VSCTCISCPECHGQGTVEVQDKTQPSGWDLETCRECRGSGVSERCADCESAMDEEDRDFLF
jgi:DnaJ-class molecular chaperone